jgi:hypothetical protein
MTLKQIASLGRELGVFLVLFVGRFRSRPGFALMQVYVQGLLSNLPRKNIEAMALELGTAPRTLQRFVESIKWDETGVRDEGARHALQPVLPRPEAALLSSISAERLAARVAQIVSEGWGKIVLSWVCPEKGSRGSLSAVASQTPHFPKGAKDGSLHDLDRCC